MCTSSDSDDEWLRVLCNSKRSLSPPENFMIDMMRAYSRDNYSRAGEHHRPATQNASPRTSNPHPFADGPCNAFVEVQGGKPWLQAAQWAVAAPPPGGQGWNTGADPAPSAQGSNNLAYVRGDTSHRPRGTCTGCLCRECQSNLAGKLEEISWHRRVQAYLCQGADHMQRGCFQGASGGFAR